MIKWAMAILSFAGLFLGCRFSNGLTNPEPISGNALIGAWKFDQNKTTKWVYKIGYAQSSTLSGNKVVLLPDTAIIIPFTGVYDTTTRKIEIIERSLIDSLSGTFQGNINDDIASFEGVWKSHSENKEIHLKMQREDINYNAIKLPSPGGVYVIFEFSEAWYNGSFGINKPVKKELTTNYKAEIGKTPMYLGYFQAEEEFEFYINVRNTAKIYYSNQYDHASVLPISSNAWRIYWEDSENIDRDFNDLVVKIQFNPNCEQ